MWAIGPWQGRYDISGASDARLHHLHLSFNGWEPHKKAIRSISLIAKKKGLSILLLAGLTGSFDLARLASKEQKTAALLALKQDEKLLASVFLPLGRKTPHSKIDFFEALCETKKMENLARFGRSLFDRYEIAEFCQVAEPRKRRRL